MARKLTSAHLNMYKEGGKFSKLFKVVKNDPELSFEIRRNDEVIIYYNKKVMLTISHGKTVKPLNPNYHKGKTLSVDITDISSLKSESIIKRYFKEAKDFSYKYSKKAEFAIQQNISLGSRNFDNGLVVVDMEWGFSQAEIEEESDNIRKTKIDLVAVDSKPNKSGLNDIYLVEVKHSLDATQGKSGMQDHVDKTFEICQNKSACNALIDDVKGIINQKSELKIFSGTKPSFCFAPIPKMMFFLSYRSDDELRKLKEEVAKLKIQEGMERPVVQYYNYTIQLQIEKIE